MPSSSIPRISLVVLSILLSAKAGAQTNEAVAQALYEQAVKAHRAGDYATACPKLEEVVKLVPYGIGARLTLARCYQDAGKLASAHAAFALVEGLAATESDRNANMRREAHDGAKALEPKLARLTVHVSKALAALHGLDVRRDGVPVRAAQWGVAVPVDRGEHRISVTATGKHRVEKVIAIRADGESAVITLDRLEDLPPAAPSRPFVVPPPAPRHDAPKRAPASLSHRGQVGAVLRVDVNGQGKGAIAASGLSYGIGDYVDVAACALLGRDKGVEPSATVLFLRGPWKPRASLGVPIFIVDGPRPGIRVAAGVQWDPIRHLGVFVDAGLALFPTVPSSAGPSYQHVVFVPSVGLQPRL